MIIIIIPPFFIRSGGTASRGSVIAGRGAGGRCLEIGSTRCRRGSAHGVCCQCFGTQDHALMA
jgi:hypothetical protein